MPTTFPRVPGFTQRFVLRSLTSRLSVPAMALIAFSGLHAQSLAVQPVSMVLLPGQKLTTMTLRNPAAEPITVQLRAYTWNQKGNDDPLAPTEDVLISPPLAAIPPGSTQIIRIAMRQPATGPETTYRVLVDQLPAPARPKEIAILLRLSIPIFIESNPHPVPKIDFRVEHQSDGKSFLVVSNNGQCHDSIREIHLKAPDGTTWKTAVPGLPYVLVGAERRWPITPDGTSHDLPHVFSLTAQDDTGALVRQVSVSEAP